MSIGKNGFLSAEISLWTQKIREENNDWFLLAEDFSKFGLDAIRQAAPDIDTKVKEVSVALFSRCLTNFQAIIILAERGLIVEATCIARVCLEGFIFLTVLSERKEVFLEEMRKNELDVNYKIISELLSSKQVDFTDDKKLEIKSALRAIDENGRKRRADIPQLLKDLPIADIYNIYRRLSRDIHPTLFSIGRYIERVGENHTEFIFDPSIALNDIPDALQKACMVLLGSVVALSAIIDDGIQTETFRSLVIRYDKLFERMSK
jgi:hypothetical protein